ncbi:MAG: glycosyltransferase [Chitinophagaceae bacterium]|nr:glycosyltransferase [Chitinophagaceae bacterium]
MKTIAFILPQNPYLPELKAYTSYFTRKGFNTVNISDIKDLDTLEYNVEWHFMGTDTIKSKKNIIKIHDYASLSTPPFPKIKNFIKKTISQKPHIRIFLNEKVKTGMGFRDNIPFGYRDMGVNKFFFESDESAASKKFDFCYLGSMQKARKVENFLTHFKKRFKNFTILMIGEPPLYLSEMFKEDRNIIFTGNIDYLKVPTMLKQCNFGINYVPDRYPFNIQTSTKLLEYCACKLKIISNQYEWVKQFEKKERGAFFFLERKFQENFTMEEIEKFSYKTPDMKKYDWDIILEQSKLLDLINSVS